MSTQIILKVLALRHRLRERDRWTRRQLEEHQGRALLHLLEHASEIHRVLKPGGEARIYDLAHWLWLPARDENRLARLAAASSFDEGEVEAVRWPGSVPAFVMLRLRRQPLP